MLIDYAVIHEQCAGALGRQGDRLTRWTGVRAIVLQAVSVAGWDALYTVIYLFLRRIIRGSSHSACLSVCLFRTDLLRNGRSLLQCWHECFINSWCKRQCCPDVKKVKLVQLHHHFGPKNCHPFSFHYSFYKCWAISIIFGTHYTESICNTAIIDLSTSLTYCCWTTWES